MDNKSKVIIDGCVLFYGEKAPYARSGLSLKGALEYDEDSDRVKCHECGEWFAHLATHIVRKHGLYPKKYKQLHGLKLTNALVSEGIRHKLIISGKNNGFADRWWEDPEKLEQRKEAARERNKSHGGFVMSVEKMNIAKTCYDQLVEKLSNIAVRAKKKGMRTVTMEYIRKCGVSPETLKHRFGSTEAAFRLANLKKSIGREPHSEEYLLQQIRSFISAHGRVPSYSDARRGLISAPQTFERRFGTWKRAIRLAGGVPFEQSGSADALRKKGVVFKTDLKRAARSRRVAISCDSFGSSPTGTGTDGDGDRAKCPGTENF